MFSTNEDKKEEREKTLNQDDQVGRSQDLTEDGPHGCSEELGLVQDQLARLTADFQNYRKRVDKDRSLWIDRSRTELLLPLLEVVDNFDRALEDAQKDDEQGSFRNWMRGFELIHKTLQEYLIAQKVSPIEQMRVFDPHLHEALVQVDVPDYKTGDIVDVMQKGYMYKDTVLRTAKVTVAK